jgi:hypothetical protein
MTTEKSNVWTKTVSIRRMPWTPGADPEPAGNVLETEIWALWAMYQAVRRIGVMLAAELIGVGITMASGKKGLSPEQFRMLEDIVEDFVGMGLGAMPQTTYLPSESKVDNLLAFTYMLLEQKQITYTEAAQIASDELEEPITADAWRMRMNRWTQELGLGRPYVRRGRPRGKKSEQIQNS